MVRAYYARIMRRALMIFRASYINKMILGCAAAHQPNNVPKFYSGGVHASHEATANRLQALSEAVCKVTMNNIVMESGQNAKSVVLDFLTALLAPRRSWCLQTYHDDSTII